MPILLIKLLFVFLSANCLAQNIPNFPNFNSHVTAELIIDRGTILLDHSIIDNPPKIGVLFKIEEGWHIYWKNPGDAGQATSVNFHTPEPWTTSELEWPMPEPFDEKGDIKTFGYKNEVLLYANLVPPPIIPDGDTSITITAEVAWLSCLDRCIPGKATLEKTINISSSAIQENSATKDIFDKYTKILPEANKISPPTPNKSSPLEKKSTSLLFAILGAIIGGIILNLMPCVLPVLSLKVFSIVKNSNRPRNEIFQDLIFFVSGVLSTFSLLALTVILLKSIGEPIGWGFQFQNPNFVYGLMIFMFILSLSFINIDLLGLNKIIDAGESLERANPKTDNLRSFVDGILVTILSTPCTAPFIGSAVALALSQSPIITILIFNAIGIGLCLPYIAICLNSRLSALIPKPGPWMSWFKIFLGCCLLGTVIWLSSIVNANDSTSFFRNFLILAIVGLTAVFSTKTTTRKFKLAAVLVVLFIAIAGAPLKGNQVVLKYAANWKTFNAQEIANIDQAVFVDFTAEWCVTCKFNEKFVLDTASVHKIFEEKNIRLYKADWTSGDPEITKALEKYGSNGVPHYVLIGKDKKKPIILSSLLSETLIKEAIMQLP